MNGLCCFFLQIFRTPYWLNDRPIVVVKLLDLEIFLLQWLQHFKLLSIFQFFFCTSCFEVVGIVAELLPFKLCDVLVRLCSCNVVVVAVVLVRLCSCNVVVLFVLFVANVRQCLCCGNVTPIANGLIAELCHCLAGQFLC